MAAYFAIKSYCVYTTNLFFREVSVINEENVPETGPTIVYSNHNNQFVDGLVFYSIRFSCWRPTSKGKLVLLLQQNLWEEIL